ncbi:MAG: LuxR C-terminal-related transcriptional regulator [Sphingomonas taxi]
MTGTCTAVTVPVGRDRVAPDQGRDPYWQGHCDHCDEATALIDADGQVLRATPAFEALLAGTGPCWSALPREQRRIDAALARATTGIAPTAAAVRFHRAGGRGVLVLVVRPIRWATRVIHAPPGVAIATLIDPAQRPAPSTQLWREAFDLTPSEAELAALLMAGHSVESAAAARDCSPSTLRVHLRHVFAKTGVSRQSDLVALLARIGRS